MTKFLTVISAVLFAANLAFAQAASDGGAPAQPNLFSSFLPFLLMFVVMYIFFILPKQKENKKTENMRKELKKGDKVLTLAGIIGIVSHIDDRFVSIKTGDTKIDFEKAAIVKLLEADAEKREQEQKK